MKYMKVNIINNSSNALPKYETEGSAGMDLRANLDGDIVLAPMERRLIPTGLSIELPRAHEGQIRPRSGLAYKKGITVLNSPGTIDTDYRGELKILLVNLSNEEFTISHGDRIAQLIIAKFEQPTLNQVESLESTDRNEGGFGSTGTN